MSSSVLEEAVASHPFVVGMSAAHLGILTRCAMMTRFEAGQIVFHEGDIANRFYLVLEGRVSLETAVSDQGLTTIQVAGPGDAFGWSWLFPPYYWHFTACAMEPTRAIFFYGTRLRECCEDDRQFGYELMRRVTGVLMRRFQAMVREVVRLAASSGGAP